MTVEQFVQMLNTNYGIDKEWPKELLVDAETYGSCCAAIVAQEIKNIELYFEWEGFQHKRVSVAIGSHNGIMFKNIELILKS